MKEQPCEDTGFRGCLQATEGPQEKPALTTPWSQASNICSCEKIVLVFKLPSLWYFITAAQTK